MGSWREVVPPAGSRVAGLQPTVPCTTGTQYGQIHIFLIKVENPHMYIKTSQCLNASWIFKKNYLSHTKPFWCGHEDLQSVAPNVCREQMTLLQAVHGSGVPWFSLTLDLVLKTGLLQVEMPGGQPSCLDTGGGASSLETVGQLVRDRNRSLTNTAHRG